MANLNREQIKYLIEKLRKMRDNKLDLYASLYYNTAHDTPPVALARKQVTELKSLISKHEREIIAASMKKRKLIEEDFSRFEAELILGVNEADILNRPSVDILNKLAEIEGKVY